MNVLRKVLYSAVLASVAFSAVSASAKAKKKTVDEMMSPDELLQELGLEGRNTRITVDQNSTEVPRLEILIDKSMGGTSDTSQRALVYVDGQLVYRWKVSTGRERYETSTSSGRKYFSATPVGSYRFHYRTLNHHSRLWNADMPFAQFFKGGVAIHATTPSHFNELGTRASGGCVRLRPAPAEKLYRLVNCLGNSESVVTVFNRVPGTIPSAIAGRATWVEESPNFQMNCSTFQDSLVMPDGRVLQCKTTRYDMPWEEKECGIRKSVARRTGQIGTPQQPVTPEEPSDSNNEGRAANSPSLQPVLVVSKPIVNKPMVAPPPVVQPAKPQVQSNRPQVSLSVEDDIVVRTYVQAAAFQRRNRNEAEARKFDALADQARKAVLAARARNPETYRRMRESLGRN